MAEAALESPRALPAEVANMDPKLMHELQAESHQKTDEAVATLPPAPADLAGTNTHTGSNYKVTVSNKAGYLCRVHVVAEFNSPPEAPFRIFTAPDNSKIFRDIQRVGARKVVKVEPNYKEVQVEQLQDIQILWIRRTFSTWLHVKEDMRDPDCLKTSFHLLRSDVLGRFSGDWELKAVRDPVTGQVVGCRGELNQDVLPRACPTWMSRLPVLGGVLRNISVRAVTRVMDDLNKALEKVNAGLAKGQSVEAVLKELCGDAAEAGHANGAVGSFAIDGGDDDEESDGAEAEVLPKLVSLKLKGADGDKVTVQIHAVSGTAAEAAA
ncbi:hypothetical protein HYH03_008027 [Edaphochlamys debaryana]|uniref:Uncharacterized protein n=1 Tax=Edaphochlamys debaryana TaxID=47281 RepID=A0A835Y362_9CHLO|nr:hypothetical protein HYH03_008027 [Edaphochlamys debaryana]|eukprot:KAG2493808.1 hypothetical protein HYH03_008027 [Edaphochlamys debaryana]